MGTGGPFPEAKTRPKRDADHSPPSSAEVEYEYELYLLSPQAPSWRVEGQFACTDTDCTHTELLPFVLPVRAPNPEFLWRV
jgi:hypothetical protein